MLGWPKSELISASVAFTVVTKLPIARFSVIVAVNSGETKTGLLSLMSLEYKLTVEELD
jgi:hypothetical protein